MSKRLLIAAAFSIASMVCGYLYIEGLGAELTGGKKVSVLIAAKEVAAGARLTREDLAVREVPEAYVHPDAISAGPAAEARLVGRPVVEKLAQGQPLLWSSFDAQRAAARSLADGVPRKQRAVTVPIDLSGGFAGMLRAGDHVDVMGTFGRNGTEATTVTLLQNVVVLAVGDQRGQQADAPANRGFNSVTLAVDLDEAELVMFAQQRGALGFALRGDGDFEMVTDIAEKSFSDIADGRRRISEYQRREGGGKPDVRVATTTAARAGGR